METAGVRWNNRFAFASARAWSVQRSACAWLVILVFLTGLALPIAAADWPQLLGPNRDGSAAESLTDAEWPKDGPRRLWRMAVGAGFAGPTVSGDRVVLFHRQQDQEMIEAFATTNGQSLWKQAYPTTYRDDFGFDPGPRATPTIASNRVYTFGAEGKLSCVSLADGAPVWSVDCKARFGAPKGFFGLACSPLAHRDLVVVNVGGRGAGVVAFAADTGKVMWKSLEDEPSYSSPVAADIEGSPVILVLTRGLFAGLEAGSGRALFQQAFLPPVHASVTGATPVAQGDEVFISAAYDLGARLLWVKGGRIETVWSGDDQLSLQFTTPARLENHLYGLHGRHDFPGGTELRCVEWRTGRVAWRKAGLGGANLLRAGNTLLVQTEGGELLRVEASPAAYRETGRAQVLGRGTRAHPALAGGRWFGRDKESLVCVDLR